MKPNERIRRQAAWMAQFEDAVIAALPELSGRIDWDTAVFFFNSGLTAAEAAARFVNRVNDDSGMAEERKRHP